MTQIDFPFHIDARGRTASAADDDHVRHLIEQVLFTVPGERVNRPSFGAGLLNLAFAPLSEPLTAAAHLAVQGALQQWLGDVIRVQDVSVETEESTLRISVRYIINQTQESRTAQFERPA